MCFIVTCYLCLSASPLVTHIVFSLPTAFLPFLTIGISFIFYDIAFIDRLLLFSLECLALPKLNLQFLTLHDYLLRNHNLFQLESTCEYSSIATALLASHTTFSTLMITVQSLLTSTFNLNHSLATSNSI